MQTPARSATARGHHVIRLVRFYTERLVGTLSGAHNTALRGNVAEGHKAVRAITARGMCFYSFIKVGLRSQASEQKASP